MRAGERENFGNGKIHGAESEENAGHLELPETRNTGAKSHYFTSCPRQPLCWDPRLHVQDGKKRPRASSRLTA